MDHASLSNQTPSDVVGELLQDLGKSPNQVVRDSERRRHPRQQYVHSISVSWGRRFQRTIVDADVFDISRTGLCIQINSSHMLKIGMEINLELVPVAHLIGGIALHTHRRVKAVVVRMWRLDKDAWIYGVRLEELLQEDRTVKAKRIRKIASATLVVIGIVSILAFKISDLRWFWYAPFYRLYGLLGAAFFISRAFFSLVHKVPKDKGYIPKISIVISVKNEEAHIAEAVKRVFDVRYPLNKMELIVIDDGSTDKTWDALQAVQPQYPHLRLFRFEKNLGKRHGMALGAQEGTGDILVYVDSDSYVEPEGIYRLVQPFADPDVGAVAGHTRVIIEPKNPISKMESVRYFISHQFFKSAESLFGTVTCCPGAFSAYRREVVLRVLPTWLNQTFFGVKATFGDDRSLTNHVLRTHRVVYNPSAVCVTFVPTSWKSFFTQQLRWKKSWARETTVASRILIKKHPFAAISYYVGTLVTLLSPLVFIRAVVVGPLLYSQSCVPYLLGVILVYLFLCLFFLFQTGETHWLYGMLFAFSYLTIMCWQTYWAILTINKTQWGTR